MTKICKDGRTWGRNNSYSNLEYKQKLSDAKSGKKNPFYKGIPKKKYKQVYDKKTKKVVYFHRKLMEKHIGRRLLRTEFVHHKDGNTMNNKIENLELLSHGRTEHAKFHSDNRRLGI